MLPPLPQGISGHWGLLKCQPQGAQSLHPTLLLPPWGQSSQVRGSTPPPPCQLLTAVLVGKTQSNMSQPKAMQTTRSVGYLPGVGVGSECGWQSSACLSPQCRKPRVRPFGLHTPVTPPPTKPWPELTCPGTPGLPPHPTQHWGPLPVVKPLLTLGSDREGEHGRVPGQSRAR